MASTPKPVRKAHSSMMKGLKKRVPSEMKASHRKAKKAAKATVRGYSLKKHREE